MYKIAESVGRSIYAVKIKNGRGYGSVWNTDTKTEIEVSVGLDGSPEILNCIKNSEEKKVLLKAIPSEDGATLFVEQIALSGECIPFTSNKGKNKFSFIAKIINYKESYKTILNPDGSRAITNEKNGGYLTFTNIKYGEGYLTASEPTTSEYVNSHTGVSQVSTTYWLGCKVNLPSEMSTNCNTFIVEQPDRFNKGDYVVAVINCSVGKDGKTYFNMEKIYEESRIGVVHSPVAAPTPVMPTPVASTPVAPTPVMSTPVAPTPVAPTPVAPTPVAPTPVAPTPVAPTPVAPTPVAPTPVAPTPVAFASLESQLPFGNGGGLPFN